MLSEILKSLFTERDDDDVEKYSFGILRRPIRKQETLALLLLGNQGPSIVIDDDFNEESVDMDDSVDEDLLDTENSQNCINLKTVSDVLDLDLMKDLLSKSVKIWPILLPLMAHRAAEFNRKDIFEFIQKEIWPLRSGKTKYLAYYLWDTYSRTPYDDFCGRLSYWTIYNWFFEQPTIWTETVFIIAQDFGHHELASWLLELGFLES